MSMLRWVHHCSRKGEARFKKRLSFDYSCIVCDIANIDRYKYLLINKYTKALIIMVL